jgi:hypothetical protein
MGWSIGYDKHWDRDIGYGVPATCDHPGCNEEIDRGLSYVCGGKPYGGRYGCGLYFCSKHIGGFTHKCERCQAKEKPFDPKPDVPEWINHKLTHESWAEWRAENSEWVKAHTQERANG